MNEVKEEGARNCKDHLRLNGWTNILLLPKKKGVAMSIYVSVAGHMVSTTVGFWVMGGE